MNRVSIVAAFVVLLASAPSFGATPAADKPKDSPGPVPFVATEAMRQLVEVAAALDPKVPADTLGLSGADGAVGRIKTAWLRGFRAGVGDSTVVSPSALENLVGSQVTAIDSLLARAGLASSRDGAERWSPGPDEILAAIHNLAALEPCLSAHRRSSRTVLLVVSSVSCECERKRCEKMLALRSSIAAGEPSLPIGVVDIIHMPAVARILSVTTIPSWILFGADGRVASIITGFEEPEDARVTIRGWLGATGPQAQ